MFFRNVINWSGLPDWFFEVVQGDRVIGLFVAAHGRWKSVQAVMSVRRVHSGGMWAGVDFDSENQLETVRLFEILKEADEFKEFRSTIASCWRTRMRRLAAGEAREGKVGVSLKHFLASIGPQNRSARWYMSPAGYLRALLNPLKHGVQERLL